MHSASLPSIQEIKQLLPVYPHHVQSIAESRIHAKAILNQTDLFFLILKLGAALPRSYDGLGFRAVMIG